jgi:hypothetical protein
LVQAAMEPFDVAVGFRVIIRRAAMRDAQSMQRFDESRRSELCAIVGGQGDARSAAARRGPFEHRLLDRIKRILQSARSEKRKAGGASWIP